MEETVGDDEEARLLWEFRPVHFKNVEQVYAKFAVWLEEFEKEKERYFESHGNHDVALKGEEQLRWNEYLDFEISTERMKIEPARFSVSCIDLRDNGYHIENLRIRVTPSCSATILEDVHMIVTVTRSGRNPKTTSCCFRWPSPHNTTINATGDGSIGVKYEFNINVQSPAKEDGRTIGKAVATELSRSLRQSFDSCDSVLTHSRSASDFTRSDVGDDSNVFENDDTKTDSRSSKAHGKSIDDSGLSSMLSSTNLSDSGLDVPDGMVQNINQQPLNSSQISKRPAKRRSCSAPTTPIEYNKPKTPRSGYSGRKLDYKPPWRP